MTKLCPRGKAAAKRKFDVYPSAYANAYASKICAGKIKDPSGVKRKDFKGPKPAGKAMGGRITAEKPIYKFKDKKGNFKKPKAERGPFKINEKQEAVPLKRQRKMGGGMTMMPRAMYGKGGGVCKKGMGRAYGKNS